MSSRQIRRESLRDRARAPVRLPFVLAAANSAAMIAAGAATSNSRIPSGQYMTGAAAVILASP